MKVNYWLLKSEPSTWSWEDQVKAGVEMWDGVRNYQARNNLMSMKKKDLCFFYHSVSEKSIIGIVEVVKEHYPDPTDKTGKFVVTDVKTKKKLKKTVSLEEIKSNPKLSNMALIKQSRLSVMPLTKIEWETIIKISEK
ncbi:MAG: EVE domain-containing protein [Proteobacteria bacterium]|nr:EVE domain-containing protein [Alphaproteobacteria bacterium]MDA0968409.1 EVE domain-containing protein [Pseudomonadota bacterium]MDA1181705.1 EVE domain-containing protein [Pseudomonadota bacterium]